MVNLWCWVVRFAPDGNLQSFGVGAIEQAAQWRGERGAFVAALCRVGLLDEAGDSYVVHDWMERAGSYQVAQRARDRRAAKPSKNRKRSVTVTQQQRASSTTRAAHGRSQLLGEEREDREEKRGEREQKTSSSCAELAPPPAAPPVLVDHTGPEFSCSGTGPKRWRATEEQVERWRKAYPGVDVEAELLRAATWVEDNPRKRSDARLEKNKRWLERRLQGGDDA
jgi:hypothetical protein